MGMGMLLIICAIASSFLLLASSSSGYSLSPSSAVIPPISSGTSSSNTFPTTSPWPNGKGLNPAAVSPPLKSDTAPQTMRGPSTSVLPSGPTTVPSNDFSPLPTTRQDTVPSPPPINSQGPVQVSLPNGPLSRPPSTKHPVLAPESPVQDESPSMKSPPTMQPVVTIAPAPVEPTLRESQKNPPTMQPIVAGFMPPRPHENGSPDTALPMPVPLAPFERPSKKSSQIPPIRQPVGIGSSPPTPHENGPPDTPIAVPIAPATAEPPLRELPQSPTTMQPVVTGSFPPSPYRNRAPYTPQSPPAMPPLVMGSTPPIPPENGSTDTPVSMPIAPGTSATEQNRKQNNIPSDHSMNPAVSPSTPAVPVSSPPSKFIGHTPPIHQIFPEEPPSSSPGKKVRQLQDKSPSMKSPPTMQPVMTIAPAPVEPTLRVAPQNPPTMQPVVAGSMPPRPHENGSPDTALPMPVPLAPAEPPSKKSSQVPPIRQPDGIGSSPPTPHENGPPDTPITMPIGPATAEPPLTELPQSPPTRQPVVTASLPPSPYRNRTPDTPQSPPAMPPLVMGSTQPSPHENGSTDTPLPMPIAPGTSATEQNRKRNNTLPGHSVNSAVSPSTPAVPAASPPSKFLGHTSPVHPRLPEEPPSSSPGKRVRQFKHNVSHVSTPPPSINGERVARPVAEPPYRMANRDVNAHTSPAKAPSTHKNMRHSSNAASPHHSPNFTPDKGFGTPSYSPSALPMKHHFVNENTTVAPLSHSVPPPASTSQGALIAPVPSFYPYSDPKSTLRHHAHPPLNSGPFPSNEISPSGSSARTPKMLLPHPFTLPPPPPNGDCSSLTCMEPFTSPPPNSSCVCALPMQIGLSLSVALYTFFPLVSELAYEIAAGVSMDSSQVRIMGANAANQYPEKTVVFIDLVPLGGQFDNTTSFLIFQKFWHKDMVINASYFGDYDVIYVRYPGLPPSPPSAPSNVGIIDSDPYSGDNGRTIHPLGVDVTRKRHRDGPNRSLVAVIVLSASVAVILCCAVAWLLLFKHRDRVCQSQPTPPATMPSLGKSPGTAASVIGSGPHSAPLSFSSSFAAYTGSAKTFSLTEIERVTDNFNETRVLGEGGFGRVYSGTLEDGTKVAVKVLKRDDHQGGREFLAEVEMLSRLHHRNLVKLIGICLEGRARCLVYELVPNGSVESHLHGVDKETTPLDWDARVKIALGAARGLAYLHEDSSPRVIHRDFKSSNILLEHDFTPKVSDFGLARTAFDEENRHISTRVMGTFGYVAPEYAMTGHLLVKSDVYSYGVVLLELLTGRKPVDMSLPPGQENLVSWARQFLTTKEGLEFIVDPSLGPDFPVDSITKVAAIASMCVQPEVSHRPFMGEVVQALKLVCSETKELESQENPSADVDARFSTASGCRLDPLHACSPCASSDCELDLERGHSMADLLSPSMRYGIREHGIHSRSGTLRTGRARRLWRKMRRLSGGSMSEHGVVFRLWPASN